MYKRMHVLVEGRDDREFVDAVMKPMLQKDYDHVQIWEYAGATISRRTNYIRSVLAMNADYLFLADINTSPCVTERKRHLIDSHNGMIDADRTIIAIREIEGWYLAGVDGRVCRELGIPSLPHTNDVTKEQFRGMMPKRFDNSVVDFMAEILRRFQIEVAKGKSRSFCYLMDRLASRSKEV